jgi:hypothetical protein
MCRLQRVGDGLANGWFVVNRENMEFLLHARTCALREQVFGLTPTVLVSFRSYALKNLSVRVSPPSREVAPKALQGRGRDECPELKSGSNLLHKGEGLEPNDRLSRAYERED